MPRCIGRVVRGFSEKGKMRRISVVVLTGIANRLYCCGVTVHLCFLQGRKLYLDPNYGKGKALVQGCGARLDLGGDGVGQAGECKASGMDASNGRAHCTLHMTMGHPREGPNGSPPRGGSPRESPPECADQ